MKAQKTPAGMGEWARAVHVVLAALLFALTAGNYLRIVGVFDLARGDIAIGGVWIGGHAKLITSVRPGGSADRAGLRAGDILEFDPDRDTDWVLAGYRPMPRGFAASVPVRRADGTRAEVMLAPERVVYLPTANDRLAMAARIACIFVVPLIGLVVMWARPGFMAWALICAWLTGLPVRVWADYYLAYEAGPLPGVLAYLGPFTLSLVPAFVSFALCFPRDAAKLWPGWRKASGLLGALAMMPLLFSTLHVAPFERLPVPSEYLAWAIAAILILLGAIVILARTFRGSNEQERARLKWAILGMSVAWGAYIGFIAITPRFVVGSSLSASALTPGNWLWTFATLTFLLSFSYAVIRERVVDVQFAISRTLVYGTVSTLAVTFIAVVHWLFGRMLEHTGLAFGLEGLAAVGLGLVLHRASHTINGFVDRVLFRKHHQAEERLRQVTAAMPYATSERSIAEAVVMEPVNNLRLASAALFYRDVPHGSLRRVIDHGWDATHAMTLDADDLLVRYLQAEHRPLRLDTSEWLPSNVPGGSGHPVLAVPVVVQHVLIAVVVYGAHTNSTLLDPDEVDLLDALARAAAASYQHVRIATLTRESEGQQARIRELEASASELRALVHARPAGGHS